MIKKKIVAITKHGITRRGHPRTISVVLECGHVHITSYSIHIAVKEFLLSNSLNGAIMRCRDCEFNRPVNVELLKTYTPYKVWNEQNFSRFETKPI